MMPNPDREFEAPIRPKHIPEGAMFYENYTFYKIGDKGLVYRWSECNQEWFRSEKKHYELQINLKEARRRGLV